MFRKYQFVHQIKFDFEFKIHAYWVFQLKISISRKTQNKKLFLKTSKTLILINENFRFTNKTEQQEQEVI